MLVELLSERGGRFSTLSAQIADERSSDVTRTDLVKVRVGQEAPAWSWWHSQYHDLPQAPGNYTFPCQFHNETTGEALSLRVLKDGSVIFNCFGKCGDSIYERVISAWRGGEWIDVDAVPAPLPPPNRRTITLTPGKEPSPLEMMAVYTGVSVEFLRTLPLKEVSGALEFHWPGKTVVKTRTVPFDQKGFSWHPSKAYNPPLWPQPGDELGDDIYITEGETDCIVLRSLGVDAYALTRGGGGGINPLVFEELEKRGVKTVFLVPDVDETGRKSASTLSRSIANADLEARVVDLGPHVHVMDGEKDLRALYLRLGRNALLDILDQAFNRSLSGAIPPKRADEVLEEKHAVHWLVPGLVARGSITLLNGQPKAGKTTFAMRLIDCLANGDSILNRVCKPSKVLYLTENRSVALQAKLELLKHRQHVFVLDRYRREFVDASWDEITRLVFDAAREQGCDLLVLDTFMAWAQPEDENSSTDILAALDPLERLVQRTGKAMIVVHHLNKDGTSPRGSGAFQAECDTIVNLTHAKGGARRLSVVSNLTKEPIDDIVFSYDGDRYVIVEDTADPFDEAIMSVLHVLGALTLADLILELEPPFNGKTPDTVRVRLKKLVEQGLVREEPGKDVKTPSIWNAVQSRPNLTVNRV